MFAEFVWDAVANHVVDVVRCMHLIGLALGLGLSLYIDALLLVRIRTGIDGRDSINIYEIHKYISIAVAVLWCSGIALLYIRTGFDLAKFSPKLIGKLVVVSVLTFNAVFIGAFALPSLRHIRHWRFGAASLLRRLIYAVIAAVSAASWWSALAFGVFSSLKVADGPTIISFLMIMYGGLLAGSIFFAVVVPYLGRRPLKAWTKTTPAMALVGSALTSATHAQDDHAATKGEAAISKGSVPATVPAESFQAVEPYSPTMTAGKDPAAPALAVPIEIRKSEDDALPPVAAQPAATHGERARKTMSRRQVQKLRRSLKSMRSRRNPV